MIYKEISSKYIITKIYRDLKPVDGNWIDDAIEWIGEALEHIGSYAQLKTCVESVTIKDHRAYLPCNVYQIIQVSHCGQALRYGSQTFNRKCHINNCVNDIGCYGQPIFYSNPNDPISFDKPFVQAKDSIPYSRFTYTTDGNWIKSDCNDKLDIIYLGFPIDEDGFPLVPDYVEFKEALYWYVRMKRAESGEPDKVYKPYDIRTLFWDKYCTQARNRADMPSIDQMESFRNQWVRMVPQFNAHDKFFANLGSQESLNRDW